MPGRSPNTWAKLLTQGIGQRVAYHRERRGMTGRALSARCQDLGLDIKPPVLSTIETGARDSVTVAEILVLARALDIAPATLLLPIGLTENVEILPGHTTTTAEAFLWIFGELETPDPSPTGIFDPSGLAEPSRVAIMDLRDHNARVSRVAAAFGDLDMLRDGSQYTDTQVQETEERLRKEIDGLRIVRARMRSRNEVPPGLPLTEWTREVTRGEPGEDL